MSKFMFLIVAAIVIAASLAGCVAVPPACDQGYQWQESSKSCVRIPHVEDGQIVPQRADQPVAQATDVPVEEPAPAAESAALDFGSCTAPDFSKFIGKPYELISVLDAQPAKVAQNQTSFTINAEAGCILYWTGAYQSPLPTGFEPLIVDGQTGVFILRSGMATVNFVGAYMPLASFDPNAQPRQDAGLATGCMPVDVMVKMLNDLGRADSEAFFRALDSSNNVEGAPYLSSRYRPEPLAPASYTDLVSGSVVMWTQTGQIVGVEGTDYVELVRSNGKSAYLNLTDKMEMTYAHTGAQLCEGLDLANKVSWWGK